MEKREPSHTVNRTIKPPRRTVWRFLKKLEVELPYGLSMPLLGIYLEKKLFNLKRYMHPNVYSITIYSSQHMEPT